MSLLTQPYGKSLMSTDNTSFIPAQVSSEEMNQWFSDLIDDIKTDHFLLETDVASAQKKEFYHALINKDDAKVMTNIRKGSSQYFIKELLLAYVNEVSSSGKKPLQLALGISDSKILVWAEIEDGDEAMEDILLLSEAKVNGQYSSLGFYINSTIIEHSDRIPVPPHYQSILG